MMNGNIKTVIENEMQSVYEKWLDNALALSCDELDIFNEAVECKLEEIAEEFGFNFVIKTQVFLIFESEMNFEEWLVGYHNDHDAGWGIHETGFDFVSIDQLQSDDLISYEEYNKLMMTLAKDNAEFFTEKEFDVIYKKLEENVGETDDEIDQDEIFEALTNAERQTLNRIRLKQKNVLKLQSKMNFFSKFQI